MLHSYVDPFADDGRLQARRERDQKRRAVRVLLAELTRLDGQIYRLESKLLSLTPPNIDYYAIDEDDLYNMAELRYDDQYNALDHRISLLMVRYNNMADRVFDLEVDLYWG